MRYVAVCPDPPLCENSACNFVLTVQKRFTGALTAEHTQYTLYIATQIYYDAAGLHPECMEGDLAYINECVFPSDM